jgi:hypothetical protein
VLQRGLDPGARSAPHALAPQRARRSAAARRVSSAVRVRAQRRTPSRRSARDAVQPPAGKFVELADFGTIRSRSTNEMETYEN